MLTVIGQGYVGLPLAILAAETGYEVEGIDLDASPFRKLYDAKSAVDEVGDVRLRAALDSAGMGRRVRQGPSWLGRSAGRLGLQEELFGCAGIPRAAISRGYSDRSEPMSVRLTHMRHESVSQLSRRRYRRRLWEAMGLQQRLPVRIPEGTR